MDKPPSLAERSARARVGALRRGGDARRVRRCRVHGGRRLFL